MAVFTENLNKYFDSMLLFVPVQSMLSCIQCVRCKSILVDTLLQHNRLGSVDSSEISCACSVDQQYSIYISSSPLAVVADLLVMC